MTLHAQTEFSIPEETIRVARAASPHKNTLIKMRDALGTLYQDQSFAVSFLIMTEPLRPRGAWL